MHRAAALLDKWVDAQVRTLHSWVERLLDQEDWQPLQRAKGCARRGPMSSVALATEAHLLYLAIAG